MTMTKVRLLFLFVLMGGQAVLAQTTPPQPPDSTTSDTSTLAPAKGMLMLDYSKIDLKGGGAFDLFGIHYLHQLNDWLYAGVGINGPLFHGNYGGFFTVDTTLHAKKKVLGDWFVNGGVALGGGGGGASVRQIKTLSGSGRYMKTYLGLGHEAGGFSYGVNVANISISGSIIKDTTLNFYVQRPVSFLVGDFSDAGNRVTPTGLSLRDHDSLISLELSNLVQINPKGLYRGNIGLVSPQFSQFFSKNNYAFFGFDLGYSGLDWYNQIYAGVGRRVALSPKWNLYGQLGIGSGGWVTDTIDTGPGLLVYPKIKAEYLWRKDLGLSVSAGYLVAPKGSSKNVTLGAAVNFHLDANEPGASSPSADAGLTLKGVRLHLYNKWLFGIEQNGEKINNVNMTTLQLDYNLNHHFYIPIQIGAATNAYRGYAGYTEMFTGLGWQSRYSKASPFQGFAQVLFGLNDLGVDKKQDVGPLLNASVGFNYGINEKLAVYGQLGRTASINQFTRSQPSNNFGSSSVGVGITYRFSLPVRASD